MAVAAGALSGCGRRGPLELPPEVQARAEAQQAAANAERARNGKVSALGEPEKAPPVAVLGPNGARPPEVYPFFLDPLL